MLDEFRYFIAVVEYKNFTKAAEHLNISQPSVSLHIKHLEEEFKVTLIERSSKQKKITITPAGKLFYERAKEMIDLMEKTKSELLDYNKVIKGKLKIGASFTVGEYFLPEFLKDFAREFSKLDIEVLIKNTMDICDLVKNKEVDIGLVEGSVPSSHFKYDAFYQDEMVLAVPYNHKLSKMNFSLKELQSQTWISREVGSGTRDYLNFFLSSNNIEPENIMIFGSNHAVKEAVKNGLGITLISSYVTKRAVESKEVTVISLPKHYIRHFNYIIPKDGNTSKAVEMLIEKLRHI
ncbi:MAG: LysR family transcriptional regulator [Clostridium lundense]|nr:LysR family transcriptional regulator [Clostridium lundense]